MRTVALYEPIPARLDGVYPYSVEHALPDAGLRIIIYYSYPPDIKPPAVWDSGTGELCEDVPF